MKLYKIKKSNIDNRGLYANRDIKDGTKIIEYKGKIVTKKKVEEDTKFDNDKAIYLCNPNCEVAGTGLKVWVYAIRDIKEGEELSYDYGFGYDEYYKDFPCRCGSKNCVGYIVREGSRWRIKKQKSI